MLKTSATSEVEVTATGLEVLLNGWVFVYKLNAFEFESRYSHLLRNNLETFKSAKSLTKDTKISLKWL